MVKDFSNVPTLFTLTNNANEPMAFRYYLVNTPVVLQAGESIELVVATSEEMAYYTQIQETMTGDAVELTPEDFVKLAIKFLKEDRPNRSVEFVGPSSELEGAFTLRYNGPEGWTGDVIPEVVNTSHGFDIDVMYVGISGTDYVYINLDGTLNRIDHPEV